RLRLLLRRVRSGDRAGGQGEPRAARQAHGVRDADPGHEPGRPAEGLHQGVPGLMAPQIDLRDLQGDILRAYGNDYDHTSYAFVHITCLPEQARAWFAGLLDHVTTAEPWKEGKPLTTLNVAVTASGLKALGVSDEVVGTFSSEFRQGMASRAPRLGDIGVNDPAGWEPGLGSGDAHVLLTINAQEKEDHQRALGKMRDAMDDAGG